MAAIKKIVNTSRASNSTLIKKRKLKLLKLVRITDTLNTAKEYAANIF